MVIVTRRELEAVLVGPGGRVTGYWEALGRPVAPAFDDDGAFVPNPTLDDPLSIGALAAGLPTAGPTTLTDDDLEGLTADRYPVLVAAAELRMLQTVRRNWAEVTQSSGGDEMRLSDLRKDLLDDIKSVQAYLDTNPAGAGGTSGIGLPASAALAGTPVAGPMRGGLDCAWPVPLPCRPPFAPWRRGLP